MVYSIKVGVDANIDSRKGKVLLSMMQTRNSEFFVRDSPYKHDDHYHCICKSVQSHCVRAKALTNVQLHDLVPRAN